MLADRMFLLCQKLCRLNGLKPTHGTRPCAIKCHNCIFQSDTQVSETLVHMDYYTALFTKVRDGRKTIGIAENRPRDKIFLPPIWFKTQLLM